MSTSRSNTSTGPWPCLCPYQVHVSAMSVPRQLPAVKHTLLFRATLSTSATSDQRVCHCLSLSVTAHVRLRAGLVDMIWGFGRAAFQNTDIYIRFYYNPKVVYTGHICTMGTDYTSFGTTAGATFYGCSVYGPGLAALGQAYRPKVCFL